MKANTFYFPHDYNARNDVKCLFLRQQLGMEGYGIFWFLIESLADANGVLPLKIVPVLAMQMQVTEVKVLAVIKNFELFQLTSDEFFSVRLNSHFELRKTLSDKGKEGVRIREAKREASRGALSPASSDPSSKERKGNKRKESKVIQTPSLVEVRQYFEDNGYLSVSAEKFYKYYDSANWHDVNGNKVRSWKQKAQSVWFKDENKMPVKSTVYVSDPSNNW